MRECCFYIEEHSCNEAGGFGLLWRLYLWPHCLVGLLFRGEGSVYLSLCSYTRLQLPPLSCSEVTLSGLLLLPEHTVRRWLMTGYVLRPASSADVGITMGAKTA